MAWERPRTCVPQSHQNQPWGRGSDRCPPSPLFQSRGQIMPPTLLLAHLSRICRPSYGPGFVKHSSSPYFVEDFMPWRKNNLTIASYVRGTDLYIKLTNWEMRNTTFLLKWESLNQNRWFKIRLRKTNMSNDNKKSEVRSLLIYLVQFIVQSYT